MNIPKRPCNILATIVFLMAAFSGNVLAGHGEESKTMSLGDDGVAIGGYDTVAYFTMNDAFPGKSDIQYQWRDATWNFLSKQHRAKFIANPEKYAPQYGAFCAMGVSMNAAVPADPEAWTIVDDKLYLNYNKEFRQKWRTEKQGNINKANNNWAVHE